MTREPIQIYLEPEQDQVLRLLAQKADIPVAEVILHSLELYIEEELAIEKDPAMNIVALGDSGKGDLAERHDHYLAKLLREESDR